jgi:hypothetical protein
MMSRTRSFAPILLLIAALAALVLAHPPVSHSGPVITVNTPEIGGANFGNCGLDEAIHAANLGGLVDNCEGEFSDTIVFDLGTGTPTINITTLLPAITARVNILGNTGGADRIELHGFGGTSSSDHGLRLDPTAGGSIIRNLVINNFGGTGIFIDASDVIVRGSFIGTNAAGDTAAGMLVGAGIIVRGPSATIGGTEETTPGTPCAGDCNLIAANNFGGIFIESTGAGAIVEGNFLGTDVTGNAAIPNNSFGVYVGANYVRIGGAEAEARNIISGNTAAPGVYLEAAGIIQGNYIGTNVTGDTALPNDVGINVHEDGAFIGGSTAAAGNVISGNSSSGIRVENQAKDVTIFGNFIGVAADGTTPLANGEGLQIQGGATNIAVGGIGDGEGNLIAFNDDPGVTNEGLTSGNPIRGNSIHDNSTEGIDNKDGGNLELPPPVINTVGAQFAGHGVSGTACASCEVDVYSDADSEGAIYEGTVTAAANGDWSFDQDVSGPNVTATANDALKNTSEFSAPFTVPSPTPTPSPTPSPTSSPTPTPTSSPAVTPTGSPSSNLVVGDLNCDGEIDLDDFLFLMEFLAGLDDGTTPSDCPDLGGAVPAGTVSDTWGDLNCDDDITAYDALQLIAYTIELELPHPNCRDIGQSI